MIKQISQILQYVNFRAMLQREGVSAFLPHLKDDDVENGVREYESFRKDTAKQISVNRGVVAFRLRDVQANVMKVKFTRVLYQKLTRVLSQDDPAKWLTRICSGTFAHVYKFKRHAVLARELAGDRDDKHLVTLLKGHAVRILKARLSAKIVSYESEGTKTVSRLPQHPNILCEHVLKSGMSISRLYDESLKQYLKYSCSLDRYGLQAVLMALAQGVSHLHKHGVGHFDIKPSNILIKWSHTRGVFDATSVVICDFGLVHELGALTDGMYDDSHSRYSMRTYIRHTHRINSSIHHIHTTHTHHTGGRVFHGVWRGTLHFSSPEMKALIGEDKKTTLPLGDRVDVYAMGKTMKDAMPKRFRTGWGRNFSQLIKEMTHKTPEGRLTRS